MAEDLKKIKGCCEGMPFAELMRKMKGRQGLGSPCAELMQKMMKERSKVQNKAEEAKEEESHVKGKH
jgi:hypothetical protein